MKIVEYIEPFEKIETLRKYLKIDSTEEDDIIEIILRGAEDFAENILSQILTKKKFQIRFNSDVKCVKLRKLPILSIDSIVNKNDSNEIINYELFNNEVHIGRNSNTKGIIEMEFTSGIGADSIPSIVKNTILQHTAYMYENRAIFDTNTNIVPYSIASVYSQFKKCRI